MRKIGFHISIAGGFKNVVDRARERHCSTIQLFSRNPRGWQTKPLEKNDITSFRAQMNTSNIAPLFVHMPYLVNLATTQAILFNKSVNSLITDLERCETLGAQFLIVHIGSASNHNQGIQQMAKGINYAFKKTPNKVMLLLENTPGSGNELGAKFEQIKDIIKEINEQRRVAVVFDTAHAFAAGYDLRTKDMVHKIISNFDRIIGIDKLKLVHFNDSKTDCASHHDRHWHIGKGKIGIGMKYILNHPGLVDKPFIMETPRQSLKDDLDNLQTVEKFLKKA